MNVLYSLQHLGYVIPPQADAGWIGEAGPGPSYLDEGSRRARERLHQPQHHVHDLEPAAPRPDAEGRRRHPRARQPALASGTRAAASTSRTPSTAEPGGTKKQGRRRRHVAGLPRSPIRTRQVWRVRECGARRAMTMRVRVSPTLDPASRHATDEAAVMHARVLVVDDDEAIRRFVGRAFASSRQRGGRGRGRSVGEVRARVRDVRPRADRPPASRRLRVRVPRRSVTTSHGRRGRDDRADQRRRRRRRLRARRLRVPEQAVHRRRPRRRGAQRVNRHGLEVLEREYSRRGWSRQWPRARRSCARRWIESWPPSAKHLPQRLGHAGPRRKPSPSSRGRSAVATRRRASTTSGSAHMQSFWQGEWAGAATVLTSCRWRRVCTTSARGWSPT